MTEHSAEANEAARQAVVERMWLNHYNDIIFKKGLITEVQHRKMKIQISSRNASTLK